MSNNRNLFYLDGEEGELNVEGQAQGQAQGRLAPGQPSIEDQRIETIIFGKAAPHSDKGGFERFTNLGQIDFRVVGAAHG